MAEQMTGQKAENKNVSGRGINLMEVCGTHTMAIAKSGFRSLLPPEVHLLSGPGCPVCVTPQNVIDAVLALTERPEITLATYGDMIRVPGSEKGDSLAKRMTAGADVRIVYSAADAVALAEKMPEREVVFLGVGFETTAPGTAEAIGKAAERGVGNFTVFSMLKRLEPSVKALAAAPDFNIQGFLCPGHVAVILGEEGMKFFAEDLHLPAVISGFEPADLAKSTAMLLRQIKGGRAELENEYTSVVRPEGNPEAVSIMNRYLIPREDVWRGLGTIPESGYGIRPEYADFDAEKKFGVRIGPEIRKTACRCGDVICGRIDPLDCPLIGKVCTPEDPEGPCMVSSEGACAAAYKYRMVL